MGLGPKGQPTKFIRGGQTTQHWWRMAAQVIRTSLFITLGAFTFSYTVLILANYELRYMRETLATWLAEYNVSVGSPEKVIAYKDYNNQARTRTAAQIAADIRMNEVAERYRRNAERYARYAALPAAAGFFISMGVFAWAGQRLGINEHVRGSRLISQAMLSRVLI